MSKAKILSPRRVTPGKLKRDAEQIRQYARFVIVLTGSRGEDVELIDNVSRRTRRLPYAKIIAVMGPVQHGNTFVEESVLMEIGYSRTRPYAQLEERPKDKNGSRSGHRWNLKPRLRSRNLREEELVLVYPRIVECMATIVLELREKWRKKGRWWVNGPGAVERGIYFTISRSDRLLHRQMVLEDVRYRRRKYLRGHAARIRSLLGKYKGSYYTCEQLKAFSKTRSVAELLSQAHYTPFYRAVVCGYFAEGSHTRTLLDSIMETFHIDVSLSEEDEYALTPVPSVLPKLNDLQCYRPPKQPAVHARGSSTFEMTLERRFREKNEIPF